MPLPLLRPRPTILVLARDAAGAEDLRRQLAGTHDVHTVELDAWGDEADAIDGVVVALDRGGDVPIADLRALIDHALGGLQAQRDLVDTARELHVLESAVQQARDGILITEVEHAGPVVVFANHAYLRLTGRTLDEVVGQPLLALPEWSGLDRGRGERTAFTGEDHVRDLRGTRPDGHEYLAEARLSPVRDPDGRTTHYVALLRDVTERKRAQLRFEYLAHHDDLTGLPNRKLFRDRLEQAIKRAQRYGGTVSLLYLDLDGFKPINDTLGHAAGDEVLEVVAERLRAVVRASDTVARLGGDEFTVVLPDMKSPDNAAIVAHKILRALGEVIEVRGEEVFVSASVGMASFPRDADTAEGVLHCADAAMYRVKEAGKSGARFWSADDEDPEERAFREALAGAVARGELSLHYQPVVDPGTLDVVGVEAMLRWEHAERGMVSPARFVPELAAMGLIDEVTAWAVGRAAHDLRDRTLPDGTPWWFSVDLHPACLGSASLVDDVRAALAAHDVAPERLVLELPEGALLDPVEGADRVFAAIETHGMHLCLDGYGAGHLSLPQLRRFPVDSLKLDRSYVARLPEDRELVRGVVVLCHSLGIGVIADGVDTPDQRDALLAIGCDALQGRLVGLRLDPT